MKPVLEFAFEVRVDIAQHVHVGRGVDEVVHFTPITGGTVAGPLLNGVVLSGGGDWSVERSGTSQLEARYLLQADDGAVIDILNRGYYRASADVVARVEAGENVPEHEYYFRTSAHFQTDAPAHRWLTEHQLIGMARDEDGQICIRFFVLR